MREKPYVLYILGTLASELDRAGVYEAADSLDMHLDDLYLDREPQSELDKKVSRHLWAAALDLLHNYNADLEKEDLSELHDLVDKISDNFLDVFENYLSKHQNLDDGRFGLNDADNPTVKAAMLRLANSLDKGGLIKEADLIDDALFKKAQMPLPPEQTAYSIYRIILHLLQRSGPEKRTAFLNNLRKGLAKLNPVDIASKGANPAAAVGAAVNIIKNVLVGQNATVISTIISELQRMV